MDANQYISGGIGASVIVALLIAKQIYNTINHKRLRSNCCGNKLEASVDIEDTTPKDPKDLKDTQDVKLEVKNPL